MISFSRSILLSRSAWSAERSLVVWSKESAPPCFYHGWLLPYVNSLCYFLEWPKVTHTIPREFPIYSFTVISIMHVTNTFLGVAIVNPRTSKRYSDPYPFSFVFPGSHTGGSRQMGIDWWWDLGQGHRPREEPQGGQGLRPRPRPHSQRQPRRLRRIQVSTQQGRKMLDSGILI